MGIWAGSARRVLELFLESTGTKYYTSQIAREAEVGRGTLGRTLPLLVSAGWLERIEEKRSFDSQDRPLRVYYELIGEPRMLRLEP